MCTSLCIFIAQLVSFVFSNRFRIQNFFFEFKFVYRYLNLYCMASVLVLVLELDTPVMARSEHYSGETCGQIVAYNSSKDASWRPLLTLLKNVVTPYFSCKLSVFPAQFFVRLMVDKMAVSRHIEFLKFESCTKTPP